MAKYLARRLLMLAVTLVVSSFVVFSAMRIAPGDPVAALAAGRSLPPESVAMLKERYQLDAPFFAQYTNWVGQALHGDLGVSITLRQDVTDLIGARVGTTLFLVAYAALIIIVFGLALGMLGALRPGKADAAVVISTSAMVAVPPFVAAMVLIAVFAVGLGWFPAFGTGSGFLDSVRHLTLPAFALAGAATASLARVTRAAVREQLGKEHVQTAVSRGISYPLVVWRHAIRNAAVPIVTLTGVTIASLITLAAVVERTFGLNGLGAYLVNATLSKDLAVVQGICLVMVVAFILVNTVVDVVVAFIDPRIRLGER